MLTGGGTGGHITPILAVAHELKRLNSDAYIVYIGERNSKYAEMTSNNPDIDEIRTVYAGKFRRYHGESWHQRLLDVRTNILNIRDLFYFILGTLQAVFLLKSLNPDVVLLKGGFVGVPTGLASAFWRYPFVTHDSDAVPGLANRLVARWARYNATAMSPDYYNYPPEKVKHVGVLVGDDYHQISEEEQLQLKHEIGIPSHSRLLLVTGGSGGAQTINNAVRSIVSDLLDSTPDLYVIHQVGKGKMGIYKDFQHPRLQVAPLLFPLYQFTGAADLIITRAGANAIAEIGVQGRACIVVPNPLLAGGHQTQNAKYLQEQRAVEVVDEKTIRKDASKLGQQVRKLLENKTRRLDLGKRMNEVTIPDATSKLSMILLDIAKRTDTKTESI